MRNPAGHTLFSSIGVALIVVTAFAGELTAQTPAPAVFPGFNADIEEATMENENFRRVIFTTEHSQLTLMSLLPGEDIGMETHANADQFVRVEAGTGEVVLDGQVQGVMDGSALVIPAGIQHNVVNTGSEPLKLYVFYTSPQHPAGAVEATKADAAHHNH